jgi:hypothetical protein
MPLTMMGCVAALRPRPVWGLRPGRCRQVYAASAIRAREASISSCGQVRPSLRSEWDYQCSGRFENRNLAAAL